MAILDLYSRRKRRDQQAAQPDVYQYDDIPRELRVQIIQIWKDAIGPCLRPDPYGMRRYEDDEPNSEDWWREIHAALAREKGVFSLADGRDPFQRCSKYLLDASSIDDILDVVEVTFQTIYGIAQMQSEMRSWEWEKQVRSRGIKQQPNDAIAGVELSPNRGGCWLSI